MTEITDPYERGFIDGMQEQMKRSVDRAVNAMSKQWVGLEPSDWPLPQYEYSQDFQIGALWAADILKEKNTL